MIFLNTAFTNNAGQQFNAHIGPTDSLIFSRNPNQTFNDSQIQNIYATSSENYDKFLPISFVKSQKVASSIVNLENIILINFESTTAQTYVNSENFTNFDASKITIAKSLAEKLNLQLNQKFDIEYNSKNFSLEIEQITEDNGLLGFDFTIPSRLQTYEGSIYLPKEKFLEISNFDNNSYYNLILLQSTNDTYSGEINQNINQKLIDIDQNLVLENTALPYLQRILGNFDGLNISQIILLLFIFPALTLIILQLYFDKKYLEVSENKLGILKIRGFSDEQIQGILLYLILFKSLTSSILGLILGFVLIKIINLTFILNSLGLKNLPDFQFDFYTILFTFSSIFIVIFLINNILQFWNNKTKVRLKHFFQIDSQSAFKLRNSSLALMGFFASIIGLFYLNSDFIKDQNLKFIGNFYLIQFLVYIISFIASKYFVINKKIIIYFVTTLIFIWNILPLTIFRTNFEFNSLLIAFTWLFFSFNAIVFFFLVIDILLKSLQFTGIKLSKNFVFVNGFIDKFKSITILFTLILQFFFFSFALTGYISSQVKEVQTTSNEQFDVYITDNLGFSEPAKVNSIVKNYAEVEKSNFLAYGNANFVGLKVKDLKNYSKEDYPNLDPELSVSDYVAFVSSDAFADFKLEKRSEFFDSNKYFLLTSNFNQENSLSPNIKIGEKLKFEINNIEIEREFLGYIESNSELPKGIYLSEDDYLTLRKEKKLFLNQNYAYNLSTTISNTSKLQDELTSQNISSILLREELIKGTLGVVDQIVFGFNIFISLAIFLILLISYLIYQDLLRSSKTTRQADKLTSRQLKLSFSFLSFLIILILIPLNFYVFPEILKLIHDNITSKYLPDLRYSFDKNLLWIIPLLTLGFAISINIFASFNKKNENSK